MTEPDWELANDIANDIAWAMGDRDHQVEPVFVGMLLAACDLSERLHLTARDERLVEAIRDYLREIDGDEEIPFLERNAGG